MKLHTYTINWVTWLLAGNNRLNQEKGSRDIVRCEGFTKVTARTEREAREHWATAFREFPDQIVSVE